MSGSHPLNVKHEMANHEKSTIPSDSTVWYQYLSASGSQINTGANGLQRMDYVVSSAQAHGLKLIINFFNNVGSPYNAHHLDLHAI